LARPPLPCTRARGEDEGQRSTHTHTHTHTIRHTQKTEDRKTSRRQPHACTCHICQRLLSIMKTTITNLMRDFEKQERSKREGTSMRRNTQHATLSTRNTFFGLYFIKLCAIFASVQPLSLSHELRLTAPPCWRPAQPRHSAACAVLARSAQTTVVGEGRWAQAHRRHRRLRCCPRTAA